MSAYKVQSHRAVGHASCLKSTHALAAVYVQKGS